MEMLYEASLWKFIHSFVIITYLLDNDIVEVELKDNVSVENVTTSLRNSIHMWLHSKGRFTLRIHEQNLIELPNDEFILKYVNKVLIYYEPTRNEGSTSTITITIPLNPQPQLHFFTLSEEGIEEEEDTASSKQCALPSLHLQGLWDSLVFEEEIKIELLEYISTMVLFSEKEVNENLVSFNRVVMLHGPPGTGKTSLCKALAQKLSIRFSHRFSQGQLVEINAHSLFSKWFSESGKLVMQMFSKIEEMVSEENTFVCILLDEVESLTAARKRAMSGNEPSDAIRVVNAVLTQLDRLRSHKNVLVLSTSNITGAIDVAFIDRADIKQYIGHPSIGARYQILSSGINELIRVGIINQKFPLLDYKSLGYLGTFRSESCLISQSLLECCKKCEGFSGRAIRKLPFLSHALYIQSTSPSTPEQFFKALNLTIEKEIRDRSKLEVL